MTINVPLKLALRDIDIEAHDVTGGDAYIYNAMYDLMNRLIDTVNAIDPSLGLYGELFRGKEQPVLFKSENFYIQNDGMYHHTENSQDEYRLIWRDFTIGWYKHPRRCLQANKELSGAEQALLLLEFRADLLLHLDHGKDLGLRRYLVDAIADRPLANGNIYPRTALNAAMEKLNRNSVSGARAPLPNMSLMMEPPLSMGIAGRPINEVFGAYVGDKGPGLQNGDLEAFMEATIASRETAKKRLTEAGIIGPNAPRGLHYEGKPFNTPILRTLTHPHGPHRMTQGQFGDYEAASYGGKTVRENWERIKAEGIEIIKEEDKTPGEKMGIGDLSVMFMYPNEIEPLDLSKLNVDALNSQQLGRMKAMAEEFKPVMVVPRHDPNLTLMAEAAMRDFKMPILSPRDIGGPSAELPDLMSMIAALPPRGDGQFLKTNSLSFTLAKNRQLQAPGPFTLNLEMPMDDYPPFVTIDSMSEIAEEEKGSGSAPQFFVRNGRIRPKKLADMVKFVLFAMYHPLLNSKE